MIFCSAEGAERDPQWKSALLHIEALEKEISAIPGWSNEQARLEGKAGVAGLGEGESVVYMNKKGKEDGNGNMKGGGQKKEKEMEKEKEKQNGKEKKEKGKEKKEKGKEKKEKPAEEGRAKRNRNGQEEKSLRARLNRHCQRLHGSDQGQVVMCVDEGKGQLVL